MVRRLYPDRVTLVHSKDGNGRHLDDVGPVDTFVAAFGSRPVDELYMALEGEVHLLFLVGDALSPARLGEATAEGARAALAAHEALLGQPPQSVVAG
jgi:hypothetical protein